jgi:outer membrane protein assembly factor BamB
MSVSEPRPHEAAPSRRGNALVWGIIVALGLSFAGLAAYRIIARDLNVVNQEKLQELIDARAKPEPPRPKGEGWPQWRGPNRDGVSTETGLLTAWPEDGPKVLWSKPVGEGYSSVVVANGYAFTMLQDGDNEAVVCWEAETGQERWRFKYPARFRNQYGNGPRSTPAIAGDYIYTVGGTGMMHCLKAFTTNPTGEAVWRKDLLAEFAGRSLEWGVAFSPLVDAGLVYVMPGGPDGQALAALDKDTGAVVWKSLDDRPSYSSPVAANLAGRRQVVFLTGERLVGVAADTGRLLWESPWDAGLSHAPTNIATPLVIHLDVGDYVFISSGYGRGCALFKIEADGDVCRVSQVYRNNNIGTIFSSCVRQGDYLYGFDEMTPKCLDVRSGAVQWQQKKTGFGKGSMTLADGHLIILGDRGTLAVAVADAHKYREVARFEHSDQPSSWTVPVFTGGRLYVRDKSRLVCYDVRKSP